VHKKGCINIKNQFLKIIKLYSKGLERNMGNDDTKYKTLFDFIIKLKTPNETLHFIIIWSLTFFIGLYFNKTFKNCSIVFYKPL
jgi:hypothetical protein